MLDAGQGISGAYCAKIQAQMGAEVIKSGPPEGGEARSMRRSPDDCPQPEKSGLFLALNANILPIFRSGPAFPAGNLAAFKPGSVARKRNGFLEAADKPS